MNLKSSGAILKDTGTAFSENRVLRLAAATAYYAIFSIGPLLVLIIGVAGLVFGEEKVRTEVTAQVQSFVGEKSANLINSMMSARQQGESLVATVIGGAALVLGAAGVFGQLQDSLNTIWGVTTKPGAGIGAFIRDRFFSMAMVLGIGFLLLVSMALSAFVSAFSHYIGGVVSLPPWVTVVLNGVGSFLVITLLFALIFKVLPDVKVRWRDVWVGALGTALLFTAGKFVLSWYLRRGATTSAYGAGSAFIVILLYVYYSSVILYAGAEFTKVFARHHGVQVAPSKYAVLMTDEQRNQQGMPRQQKVEEESRKKAA